jgi:hypothetical protein
MSEAMYWKHANVAPAYKKGEKYNAANYRPISLTCISCKIMEHVIMKTFHFQRII